MRTMIDLVFEAGSYESPPIKPSLLARWFPSPWFYARFIWIVWYCSRMAKRGEYDDEAWYQTCLRILDWLEHAGVRFRIEGMTYVKDMKEPCVYVANHMSMLETIILPGIIRPFRDVTFVVKESLLTYPWFGHIMRAVDPIAVSRADPRADFRAVMEGGVDRLKRNRSVVVFPQTTRMPVFDRRRFNTIGVKLARRAGAPIVPLALKTDAWENGKWIKDLGRIEPSRQVHFEFGEPIRVEGSGADAQEEIVRFIESRLKRWGAAIVDAGEGSE